jgi:site-specific DNA recombinase
MSPTESNALIYLRVSTDRQAQKGIALPTQEERCLAYAHETGYRVDRNTGIYVDSGESARTMDRPALLDLLTRCKEDNSIRAVIFYDVSRLARNRLDFAFIKQALRKAGVSLVSATEPIDDTPEGQMLEGVLSTVAEFFSAQSARKVRANMRRKAESGGWPCHAPYGYQNRKEKLPDGQIRAWIEPDPIEAPWVRRAFELFATGSYSVKSLARELNREGIIVRKQKNRKTTRFHHAHLEKLLHKKIYIGIIEWGDVLNENGSHEPLIEPDLFYRVESLLLVRSGSTVRMRRHRSLFKKIALCGECKSAMTIDLKETSSSRTIRYLRCRKVQKGKPVSCAQPYFSEEVYIDQLANLVDRVELHPEGVEMVRHKLEALTGEEKSLNERAKTEIERQLDGVRTRQQNLLLRSLDDDPHDELQRSFYDRIRAELLDQERGLMQELKRLSLSLGRIVRIAKMTYEIAGHCSRAFALDKDPDYRGLLTRVLFRDISMMDGMIVDATLSESLVFTWRWANGLTLMRLADLGLCGAPPKSLIDGSEKRPKRQVSLSKLKADLLRLQEMLTEEEKADIENCYYELCRRNLLPRHD